MLAHSYREVIESDVCIKVQELIELPTCLPAYNRRQDPMSIVGKLQLTIEYIGVISLLFLTFPIKRVTAELLGSGIWQRQLFFITANLSPLSNISHNVFHER